MARLMEHPLWMTWVHASREAGEEVGIIYTPQQLIRGFRRFLRETGNSQAQQAA